MASRIALTPLLFVLFVSASFLLLGGYSAPTASTPTPSTCEISLDLTAVHDSSCLDDDFEKFADDLGLHYVQQDIPFNCSIKSFLPKSEPLIALYELANSVDLLNLLPELSAINTNYSDHICRMKETVIPFLNQTLNSICACPDEDCDMNDMPTNLTTSDDTIQEPASEYCLVRTIHRNLELLLNRVAFGKHTQQARAARECRIGISTRYQLTKIRNDIDNHERTLRSSDTSCPILAPPTSLASTCHPDLSSIGQMTTGLVARGYSSLANQLDMVLPEMARLLGKENGVCTLNMPLPEMSDYCIMRNLKTYYFKAYDFLGKILMQSDITLDYISCPSQDNYNMAALQQEDDAVTTTAAPPVVPRFIVPPTERIPQRPRH